MALRSYAKPILGYLDNAFADLSDIKFRVSYCLPRGTTDAPQDDETILDAISVVLT
jgi:hypothetical protein